MISFYKTFHSFLGFPGSDDRRQPPHQCRHLFPPPDLGGLRLLAADSPKPPHVLESPTVGPAPCSGQGKPSDPGAWGLHEAAAVGGGGLGLCTESLGCESCDVEVGIGIGDDNETEAAQVGMTSARRSARAARSEARFPPPLPWMTGKGGRRSRFLRGERRDGRLVLTEFRINPPQEMLRASRRDGRLRLNLVGSGPELGEEEEEEEESPTIVGVEGSEIDVDEGTDKREGDLKRWELLRVWSEGQRCVDAVSGNGTAPMWWNHRFVTTA
ncbi:Protein fantastic four 1 [Apostasia shenzhenica]|uniref:Protein fantastic four 1 n=1 Tax=Apostasia shenzhenica TaxID=1088818 RepID=A0A2H9ZZ78_9ASPA|nr:Protein fantastic four 1 [Apostasia shenzhenica]